MNITKKVYGLNLPENSFIIVGSGILSALGIRESKDIDMIVSLDVFKDLKEQGWAISNWPDQEIVTKDDFEVGTKWSELCVNELLINAVIIEGIPYLNLDDLKAWKLRKARPKDIEDITLIDTYLKTH